jgi:tetratricopeptide (TPR) repeat protein
LGVTYLQDPSNPYQLVSEKTDVVDYVQFPRETLLRRSGDCDDLVVLYSAALESLGIRTKLVDVPGHMFLMFALGDKESVGGDTLDGMLVEEEGILWVPVEVTQVGSPFMKGWETGSVAYHEWKGKGLVVTDPIKAWERYKPASLPVSEWRPKALQRAELDRAFDDEVRKLKKLRLRLLSKRHLGVGGQDDPFGQIQIGILYAEAGELEEALRVFIRIDSVLPERADIKNNIGNIYFLQERYDEARVNYEAAALLDAGDPLIQVNIARAYLKLGKTEEAKAAFRKACELRPEVTKTYRTLALDLSESL